MMMTPVPYKEWESHPSIPDDLGKEWENHSYIVRSYSFMDRTELMGPIPDVLMGEVMKEIEDVFKDTMNRAYNDIFDRKLGDYL